jgi:PKD repeat protein
VIIIYPMPNLAIVAPAEVCHNTSVTFSATGNGIGTYNWSFVELDGTSSSQQNPVRTFVNTGTLPIQYNIKLTATSVAGCVDTVVKPINVYPQPSASFTATPEAACGASPVIFDASSSVSATTFSWNFSDGTPGVIDTNASMES